MKGKKLFVLSVALLLAFTLLLSACSAPAPAEEEPAAETESSYPEKPVTVLVGFSPGGGTDTAARLVFQYAEKYFGESFAIVNMPGASGEIAWTELAFADPDGYTIGFINPPTFVAHPIQREGCKYVLEDFAPIANIVTDPGVIVVAKESAIQDLDGLFEAAGVEENAVSMAYSGPGTSEALMLRKLEKNTGTVMNKVPFDGSAPSMVALLGGHVDAVCMNVSEAINYANDGNIRILGVTSPKRVNDFPDVPTFVEQNYDIISVSLRGVAAPAAMDKDQIKKIEDAIEKALADPEFIAKATEMKLPLDYLNSTDYMQFLTEISDDLKAQWEVAPW